MLLKCKTSIKLLLSWSKQHSGKVTVRLGPVLPGIPVFDLLQCVEGLGTKLDILFCAVYLGLGRRYEAGICTIVISMNGAFQRCPLCCRLNFDPKS